MMGFESYHQPDEEPPIMEKLRRSLINLIFSLFIFTYIVIINCSCGNKLLILVLVSICVNAAANHDISWTTSHWGESGTRGLWRGGEGVPNWAKNGAGVPARHRQNIMVYIIRVT
jgi:hypothetical protein